MKSLELLSRLCIRLGVQIPNVPTKSMELLFAVQMALELQSAGGRGFCIIQWSAFSEYGKRMHSASLSSVLTNRDDKNHSQVFSQNIKTAIQETILHLWQNNFHFHFGIAALDCLL